MKISKEMFEKLQQLAQRKCFFDNEDEDVIVDDFDDAFNIGETAGEVMLAREILADLVAERLA